MQKPSISYIFIWVTVPYFCLRLNEIVGVPMGLAQCCMYKCASPFYLRGRPVRPAASACDLSDRVGKTFLDHEGYDGVWMSGSDSVKVVLRWLSFPFWMSVQSNDIFLPAMQALSC